MFFGLQVDRGNLSQAVSDNMLNDLDLNTNGRFFPSGIKNTNDCTRLQFWQCYLSLLVLTRRTSISINLEENRARPLDSNTNNGLVYCGYVPICNSRENRLLRHTECARVAGGTVLSQSVKDFLLTVTGRIYSRYGLVVVIFLHLSRTPNSLKVQTFSIIFGFGLNPDEYFLDCNVCNLNCHFHPRLRSVTYARSSRVGGLEMALLDRGTHHACGWCILFLYDACIRGTDKNVVSTKWVVH